MQENIIGYLLGALDADERARFEAALELDEELQRAVQLAAESLQVLKDAQPLDPPAGLAEETARGVFQFARAQASAGDRIRQLTAQNDSWSLFDMTVAASILFVACLLLVPAIEGSRIHAQIAGCQNNLRTIGQSLIQYSEAHKRNLFPQIPEDPKTGIAGIYSVTLREAGFINEDHNFYCPSLQNQDLSFESFDGIPKLSDFHAASGEELERLQKSGGSYGYNMGYFQNGQLRPIRNRNRGHYPLCADRPATQGTTPPTHCNLLFESGGVRLFSKRIEQWNGDYLFEDLFGHIQAGFNSRDVVIGASHVRANPR